MILWNAWYIGRPQNGAHRMTWRHSNLWSYYFIRPTISMLWGNSAYCVKLCGEDLNQSVWENVRIIVILLRKWCHNNKHFSEFAPHHGGKTAGVGGMKKLCNYHPSARRSTSTPLIQQLHWLPVRQRIDHKLVVLTARSTTLPRRSTSAASSRIAPLNPVTRCNLLSNRFVFKPDWQLVGCLYNDTTGCQYGWTTCCIVYTNIQPVVKLVVQPVVEPVWQPVVSCKQIRITCRLHSFATSQVCKPTTRTNFADRAFRCSAPAVWNSLTAESLTLVLFQLLSVN